MSRIAYLSDHEYKVSAELLQSVKARRPQARLFNLDRILLYSEPCARGWNTLLGGLRKDLTVATSLCELVILRISHINKAHYELEKHTPEALKAGITPAQLEQLADWQNSSLFNDKERAVLAYTDAMSLSVQVSDAIYQQVEKFFNPHEIVELTTLIAAYNMVSRFLEALQITSTGE